MRTLLAAVVLALLIATPAQARLRPVAGLKAKANAAGVKPVSYTHLTLPTTPYV